MCINKQSFPNTSILGPESVAKQFRTRATVLEDFRHRTQHSAFSTSLRHPLTTQRHVGPTRRDPKNGAGVAQLKLHLLRTCRCFQRYRCVGFWQLASGRSGLARRRIIVHVGKTLRQFFGSLAMPVHNFLLTFCSEQTIAKTTFHSIVRMLLLVALVVAALCSIVFHLMYVLVRAICHCARSR